MLIFALFSYLLLSALSYWFCVYLIRMAHAHALLDEANERSSHKLPTPRIGGISFVVLNTIFICGYFAFTHNQIFSPNFLALLLPPLLVALVSVIDDIKNGISRKIRLIAHLGASALLIYLVSASIELNLIILIGLCVAIVWFINLYNFMDGIDGIAISEGIFMLLAAAAFALTQQQDIWAILLIYLTAPLVGFLIINWQPARTFMGDIGSTYLGLLIASVLLLSIQQGQINYWAAIILTGTFLMDASWTLGYRIVTRQAWYSPHRSHLYQILARKLESHQSVNLINLGINFFWLLPLGYLANSLPQFGYLFTLAALLPLLLACGWAKAGKAESN
jgi:Fuc2NAc and GlcNAc transferase